MTSTLHIKHLSRDQERIHVQAPFGTDWYPIEHLPYYVDETFVEMTPDEIRHVVSSYSSYADASKNAGNSARYGDLIPHNELLDPVGILLVSTPGMRISLIHVDGGVIAHTNERLLKVLTETLRSHRPLVYGRTYQSLPFLDIDWPVHFVSMGSSHSIIMPVGVESIYLPDLAFRARLNYITKCLDAKGALLVKYSELRDEYSRLSGKDYIPKIKCQVSFKW